MAKMKITQLQETQIPYSAFEAFRPHFDALARVGYYKIILRNPSPWKHFLHEMYRIFIWIVLITYNLQHILRVIQVRHSSDEIVNVLFILLTTLNIMGKQLNLNLRTRRVEKLIELINGPIFASKQPNHVKLLQENAGTMKRVLNFYIGSIFSCGLLWAAFPFVNKLMGVDVQFTAYFPFDTSGSPAFEISLCYMSIFITLQAYGNVTMDCTIVSFYAQAKVQMQILRDNLENLVPEDKLGHRSSTYIDEDKEYRVLLRVKLIDCVNHHRKIIWVVKEIESIFGESLAFLLLVSAWVVCMTMYKIVGLELLSAEFLPMVVYLLCILAQLFVYCYYGTQLKYESEYLNQSIYCCRWRLLSPRFRTRLLVMMQYCVTPITPRTAVIVPISLETYIAVLRASYTFFTFLNKK